MGSINLYKLDDNKVPDFLRELGKYESRPPKNQKVLIDGEEKEYEFQLFIYESQEKKAVAWNWVMDAFEEEEVEVTKAPSALLKIKTPTGCTYAVTFAHSFFLADKYCDREFAFNFARRLEFEEIRTTALTSPNSQRNRTVNSYINYKNVEFDSGESFSKIKFNEKQDAEFSLYSPTLEIGNSIKFNVKQESLDTVAKLIEHVEHTIWHEDEKNKIPVFSKVKDKSKIERLNARLRETVANDPTQIIIPEFDIIGANEVFNRTDCEFDLLCTVGNEHYRKHITNLSYEELKAFCDENSLVYGNVVLDILVASYKDGKAVVRRKVQDLIDVTDDQERSVLSKGIWYDFNDDYLTYLSDSIAEIDVEYHPQYDFTKVCYEQFLEQRYQEEQDSLGEAIEEERRKKLKRKYYAERVFNTLREMNDGFENYDRNLGKVGEAELEPMDLYRNKTIFAVKIGAASSKLCYAVDQSLSVLRACRSHAIKIDVPFDTVALWFVLDKVTHIEDQQGKPDLNRLKMLMLKNRLDQWKKEVRLLGLKPLIYINYDQR